MHHVTAEFSKAQTIRIPPVTGGADEALLFLKLLGKDPAATRFRFFPHKENPNRYDRRKNPNGIGARSEIGLNHRLFSRYQAEGRGAYFVVGDGGTTNDSITSFSALFVEWDDKPLEWQRTAWRELGLPEPSLQVETGGKSLHTYWVLDQALPPDQWREAQQRLAKHGNSDSSLSDPAQLMRLPGYDYIGPEGTPTGRTRIASAVGTRYTLEQLLANVPELPEQPKRKAAGKRQAQRTGGATAQRRTEGSRSLQEIREALACIPSRAGAGSGTYETYRNILWGLIKAVEEAGGTEDDAIDLMEAHSPDGWDVPQVARSGGDEIAAGTFWHHAKEAGWVPQSALPELRRPDLIGPAGVYIGNSCPIPSAEEARLVALAAPMGSGKTVAITAAVRSHRDENRRTVLITHRRSLGATLAEKLDLPWARAGGEGIEGDAVAQRDARQLGIALCIDSLTPRSGMRFDARAWRGAVVVIDEVEQVLSHALMAQGTTVANRRREVLRQLQELLKHAAQVIVADAQLSDLTLKALEEACDCSALLIGSEHKPAAGREVVAHTTPGSWRIELVKRLEQRERLWIATTAQKAGSKNTAQNLAVLVTRYWPDARVLVVDSENIADPGHPAVQLALAPDEVASDYDVVIATPAVAAGLSVTLQGHFQAVFGFFGGATDAAAAAQAMARVRDGCVRHVYAGMRSPGGALRIGSGAGTAPELLEHLSAHEARCVTQLLAFGWQENTRSCGPWLQLWGELAARQNRQRQVYRGTVLGLLKREGYRMVWRKAQNEEKEAAKELNTALQRTAAEAVQAEDRKVIDASPVDCAEAEHLRYEKRHGKLTPGQQIKLTRWEVAEAWQLKDRAPTEEVMAAHRDRLHRRLRFGWVLLNRDGRSAVQESDYSKVSGMHGDAWAPDLCRAMEGPRIAMADLLRLPQWLERADGEWFDKDDPQLIALHHTIAKHASELTQVLGISPCENASTELKHLLALAGYKLQTQRRRSGKGRNASADTFYRIVRQPLPDGVDLGAMEARWLAESSGRIRGEHAPSASPPDAGGVYANSPDKESDGSRTHHQPVVGERGWGAWQQIVTDDGRVIGGYRHREPMAQEVA